jgi:hypothetical protein
MIFIFIQNEKNGIELAASVKVKTQEAIKKGKVNELIYGKMRKI